MSVPVIGRDAELAAVAGLVDTSPGSEPAGLVLWGEAGIGKSTLWRAGVEAAREQRRAVMLCRPAEAEQRLSYSGLTDLLAETEPTLIDNLASPQRDAINAALLRSASRGRASDQRAVAAAFLSILNASAAAGLVLLAIDDIQWLDGPTARVIGFSVRRCHGPVAVLVTERARDQPQCREWLGVPDTDRMTTVRVGALTVGALHRVVRNETGRSFARPAMVRIAEVSGGNPFYAVEVARSWDDGRPIGSAVSVTAEGLVRDRLAKLDGPVADALLVTSAVAEPTAGLIRRATGATDVGELLESMEDSGLVEILAGRVRFTHPLWANAIYNGASAGKRRVLHRQLSELVDDVEERARHLALATTELDEPTVAALDAAADHARRRGAASAAAELAEMAFTLGATDPLRRIRAARDHFDADDLTRARELTTAVVDSLGPGGQRAEALGLLGTIVYEGEDFGRSIEILEQAFLEAGDDSRMRGPIAIEVSFPLAHSGRVADATAYIQAAIHDAETTGDDGLLAEATAAGEILRVIQGHEPDMGRLNRALALEDLDRRGHALRWPSFNSAALKSWRHDVAAARKGFAAVYDRCVARGAESDLWLVLGLQTQLALWSGDIAAARAFTREMSDRAQMTSSVPMQAFAAGTTAIVDAWCGGVDTARTALTEAFWALAPSRFATGALHALAALGKLELSVGNHSGAADYLAPAVAQLWALGIRDPEVVPLAPDAAEALIASGRLSEATPIVELLEDTGTRPGRHWARAVGARCRGLLLCAAGDLDHAADAYERAVEAHHEQPLLRFELARTLLVVGQLQRRRGDRRGARASLERAAGLFDDSGATRWASNARTELERVGLRHGPADRLTPAEERVAELAAEGLTNKEVAARLYVSTKTVEAHLARIYRKLGVRSRAQLGRRLASDRANEGEPTAM